LTDHPFGARLRHERERRGITLASIAATTKIAPPLLVALERGDISRWPGGIYRRSFIKAYAEAVGLDAAVLTREFLESFPDPGESTTPTERGTPPAGLTADAVAGVRPGTAPAPASTPTVSGMVRLSIEKMRPVCRGGCLLPDTRQRLGAAASDLGILAVMGLGFAATLGQFWMPLAIVMACYYLGGILVLGNTPGVCLFAAIVKETSARGGHARQSIGPDVHHPSGASPERC
jgi:transcriptional regulator with XRE-family HTH domain